jgi:hypothetical protein
LPLTGGGGEQKAEAKADTERLVAAMRRVDGLRPLVHAEAFLQGQESSADGGAVEPQSMLACLDRCAFVATTLHPRQVSHRPRLS